MDGGERKMTVSGVPSSASQPPSLATLLPGLATTGTAEPTSIKVYCRLRQQNQLEKREGAAECSTVVDQRTIFLRNERCDVDEIRCTFDRVFDVGATQGEVYEHAAKPLVSDFLQGYNCTIFAYGQTGSGKTHTILGPKDGVLVKPEEEGGIISRVVKDLFREVEKSKSPAPAAVAPAPRGAAPIPSGETVELTVSFVEIYMEQIRDLLVAGNGSSSASSTAAAAAGGLKIRENAQKGIFIEDMTQVQTATENATMELVKAGILNRAVSSTRMNKDSSRSHSILIITCTRKSLKNTVVKRSSMYIVDLAGSEFVNKTNAAGKVLQEAKAINKSLSALSNVIKALVEGKKHVPYRDSKLTRILQDSLGGSAKTCLILAASCSSYNMSETISTLRFGLRAKEIKNPVMQKQESAPGIGPGGIFKELYQQAMEELEEKNKKIDELQRLLSAVVLENQQLVESERLQIQDEVASEEQQDQRDECDETSTGGGEGLLCPCDAGGESSAEGTTENECAEHSSGSEDEEEEEVARELEAALREKEEFAQKTVTLAEENKRLFHVLEALESQLDQVAVDFTSGKPILSLRAAAATATDAASPLLPALNLEPAAASAHEHMLSLKIWLQSDKWQQSLEAELMEPANDTAAVVEPSPSPHKSAAVCSLAADSDTREHRANVAAPTATDTEISGQSPSALFLLPCANNTDTTPCVHRLDAEALSRQIVELKLQLHYVSENTKLALDGESYVIVLENAKLKTRIEELEFQANLGTVACNQLEMKNRACETRLSNQETHIGCLQNSLHEYQGLFKQQIIMSQEKCRLLTDELEFYKKLAKCGQPLGSGQHLSSAAVSPPKSSPSPRKHRGTTTSTSSSSSSAFSMAPKVSAALFPELSQQQECSPSPTSNAESGEVAGTNPFGLWRGFGSFYRPTASSKSGTPTPSGGTVVEIELAEKPAASAAASTPLPPAPNSPLSVRMSRPIVKPIGAAPLVTALPPSSTDAANNVDEKQRQPSSGRHSPANEDFAPWIVKGFGVGNNDANIVGAATSSSSVRAPLPTDATLDELAAPIEMH